MTGTVRVPLATLLPGLRGHGVLLASPVDAARIRRRLTANGFAVAETDPASWGGQDEDTLSSPPSASSGRRSQAAIAAALRLPESAGRNLDAMVDSLRDLAVWWPDHERVALLWHGADALVDADLPGYLELTEILRAATDDLWRGGMSGDRVFETVALVDRHGVPALPEEPDRLPPAGESERPR